MARLTLSRNDLGEPQAKVSGYRSLNLFNSCKGLEGDAREDSTNAVSLSSGQIRKNSKVRPSSRHASLEDVQARKEITHLELRGFRGIGAMNSIELDIRAMRFTNGPGIGFRRVRRAH